LYLTDEKKNDAMLKKSCRNAVSMMNLRDMKRNIIMLMIIFLWYGKTFSQTDFRNGFIINYNNDTIYGLIDYKGNRANSKKCVFKKDLNSTNLELAPSDIKAYKFIDSKYYVSKIVDSSKTEDLLFLEYLINGIVDIYFYRDINGEHYLLDNGDGKLVELKNDVKELFVNDIRYFKDSKEYIGILKYAFKESPTVIRKVDNVTLDSKSLINITKEYHNAVCRDEECIIYEKKIPKMKVLFGFGPLVSMNTIQIILNNDIGEEYYYLWNSNFDIDYYLSVGFFLRMNIPNLSKSFHLDYEGAFGKWTTSTYNSYIEPIYSRLVNNNILVKQKTFNNSLNILYEFPRRKLRPMLEVGYFFNYLFKTEFSRETEITWSWGDIYYKGISYENPFSKYYQGLNLGAGLNTKITNFVEFFLIFEYKRGFGLLENNKEHNTDSYSLNIGIQFGR